LFTAIYRVELGSRIAFSTDQFVRQQSPAGRDISSLANRRFGAVFDA
jgi:hypothetical protein